MKIYLLGGVHIAKIKNQVATLVKGNRIQTIFREGVTIHRNIFTLTNFVKSPFTLTGFFLYFRFLRIFGKDNENLGYLEKELNVKVYPIDTDMADVLLNNPINIVWEFIFLFLSFFYIWKVHGIAPLSAAGIILSILLCLLTCVAAGAYLTLNFRNKIMVKNSQLVMKKYKYERALLYCGLMHVVGIERLLRNLDIEIEKVESNSMAKFMYGISKYLPFI